MGTTSDPGIYDPQMISEPEAIWQQALSTGRGFTLLELLVVIMVIGILLGLVMPGAGVRSGQDLTDTARRMSMIINHARQEAMLSSRTWRLEIDPDENVYRFQQRLEEEFVQVSREPFAESRLHPNISITELEINGQNTLGTGLVYLFPTGEQDTFRLSMQNNDRQRILSLGSLGPPQLH